MSNPQHYPFHKSLSYVLASVESPLYAMRLIRAIAFNLDVTTDQVEVLIGLAAQKYPTCITKIFTFVPHLSQRKVINLVRKLKNIKAIVATDLDVEDYYVISPDLAAKIKDLDKESLQSGIM